MDFEDKRYQLIKPLGNKYNIFSGYDNEKKKEVSIEFYPYNKKNEKDIELIVKNDIQINKRLQNNKYIIEIYDYFKDNVGYYIVMEKIDGKLSDIYSEMKINHIKKFIKDFCCVYKVLFDNNILYRSINLDNILIKRNNSDYDIKFSNFHYDKNIIVKYTLKYTTKFLSWFFGAPEISEGIHDNLVDMWDFGIILYFMIFKNKPKYENNKIQFVEKDAVYPEFLPILKKMLDEDREKRCKWEDLFKYLEINEQKNINKYNLNAITFKNIKLFENCVLNKKYKILSYKGRGAFGIVYKGINLNNNELVAIKSFPKNNINEEAFNNEISAMIANNSINSVKYYEKGNTDLFMYFTMEYLEVNFREFIETTTYIYNYENLLTLFFQFYIILYKLNKENLIHRDIKPENIFIKFYDENDNLNFDIKLGDYGSASDNTENFYSQHGTYVYIAPEIRDKEKYKYNYKQDLYSILMCLLDYRGIKFDDLIKIYNNYNLIIKDESIKNKLTPKISIIFFEIFQKRKDISNLFRSDPKDVKDKNKKMFFHYKNIYFKDNFKYYYIYTTKTMYYGEIGKICKNKLIKHGMGILGYKDCGLVKIGEFKNDKIENTLVVLYLNNGKNLLDIFKENLGEIYQMYKNNIIEKYIGKFNNNEKGEGYGIYYYYNREIYVGYWKDNYKIGYGIFLFDNGDLYVGEWKNDGKDGCGFNRSNNGDIYIGQWKDNNKEGYGTYYSNNGDVYIEKWERNILKKKKKYQMKKREIYI